jgi:hypothetical protein
MTRQCREVLSACDFPESDVRELEVLLTEHSPQQITALVWHKDPKGEHGLDWFRPFFKGYVKKVGPGLGGEPDDGFWQAYGALEVNSAFDLPKVYEMSREPGRLDDAMKKCRVRTPAYVYEVFRNTPARRVPERTKIDLQIGNGGTETREL